MSDDAELDFDDPSFLVEAAAAPVQLSYHQNRARKLNLAHTRKPNERERRVEGLSTNLISSHAESKAVKMMRGMGYAPGESLGKRANEATEPIGFEIRQGKTGLGIPPLHKKVRVATTPAESSTSATTVKPDLSAYLARSKDVFNEKRAGGLVVKARRTAEELDRRNGIEASSSKGGWRWQENADDVGEVEQAKVWRKERLRKSFLRDDYEDDAEEVRQTSRSVQGKGKGVETLDYASGLSGVVVDDVSDEEKALVEAEPVDQAEREAWFSQDTSIRLAATLQYLRQTYSYCFWCGCAYDGEEDMKENCPGEDEIEISTSLDRPDRKSQKLAPPFVLAQFMLRSPARLSLIKSHLSPSPAFASFATKQMSTNSVRKLADGGEVQHGLQLEPQRAEMIQDIISLFCSKPSREKLDKHFAPNATFEDPICIAHGLYPEVAAQWFGMPKAFPISVTEAYTVTRNEQNLIEYEQRQNYTIAGLGTQKVMYSLVHMELDNNGKIIKFEDRWNGSPQPANAVAKFLRRLNGKTMPKIIGVPKA